MKLEEFSRKYIEIKGGIPLFEGYKSKFTLLISDIINNLSPQDLITSMNIKDYYMDILKVVDFFSEFINTGDSLLDNQNFGSRKKAFIERLSYFAYIPWKAQEFVQKLPLDGNELMIETLYEIEECVRKEASLVQNPARIGGKEMFELMQVRNCDFFLFLKFLSPFMKKQRHAMLVDFFRHYVVIDSILDDITDIKEDRDMNSFNILLNNLSTISSRKEHSYFTLMTDLKENGIFNEISSLVNHHYNAIKSSVATLGGTLPMFLMFLANGCVEGFRIYEDSDYFLYIDDPEKHSLVVRAFLKPYPWNNPNNLKHNIEHALKPFYNIS